MALLSIRLIQGSVRTAALAIALGASTALASGTPPPPPRQDTSSEMPVPASKEPSDQERAKAARAEAENLYTEAYRQAETAKAEKKAGKAKEAKKHFGKALKKFQGAADRDPAYYQAWNMIGYCSRNLGDLKRAFAAYEKCLSIQPDYEEAHEYLGEAYVQSGDLLKAKVELAWLRAHDSDEADELAEDIEKAEGKAASQGEEKESPAEKEKPAPSGNRESDSGRLERASAPDSVQNQTGSKP
jgi:tetratricopeptide (TPR) repeat protein